MTTRPGYIYSGTEWVSIGQEAAVSPFKYQATAPTSPATGDIWIDSSSTVNSIDSTQMLRWRKTMSGGETSLSGNDDASLPLTYTPGYEQLYINGVLQVRGVDYTATTGTTVTGLTALVANDVVEVFSAVAFAVSNVYTQTQSDSKYQTKIATGASLVIPTSITKGASGSASVATNGQITFTGTESITIDNCFTSAYDNYKVVITYYGSTGGYIWMQSRVTTAGVISTDNGTSYWYNENGGANNWSQSYTRPGYTYAASNCFTSCSFEVFNPVSTSTKTTMVGSAIGANPNTSSNAAWVWAGGYNSVSSQTGLYLYPGSGGTFTGTIRVYGYNNGA